MISAHEVAISTYLTALPEQQRHVLSRVRELMKAHLPTGFEEQFGFGMICYVVPIARHPTTYNKQPLMYLSLGAQKHHCALYLMCASVDREAMALLEAGFARHGTRMDMGKACVRFTNYEAVPWDAIAALVARYSVAEWIEITEAARAQR